MVLTSLFFYLSVLFISLSYSLLLSLSLSHHLSHTVSHNSACLRPHSRTRGILHSSLNLPLVQDSPEPLKDRVDACGCRLGQHLAALDHKVRRHLNGIFSGVLQEQGKNLECEQLMNDLLVD